MAHDIFSNNLGTVWIVMNVNLITKVKKKFIEKNWTLDDIELNNSRSVFNKFCSMLNNLNEIQQNLILELTDQFLRIKMLDYSHYLDQAIARIDPNKIAKCQEVYVLPLIAPADIKKTKSSRAIHFMWKSHDIQAKALFNNIDIKTPDEPRKLPPNVRKSPCLILLVDDFVGTGETAISAIRDLLHKRGVGKDKIVVVVLVAQEKGIQAINNFGVEVYAAHIVKRGISDAYVSPQREQYLEIMKSIEELIESGLDYRFGYKGSEALVTMNRTPDNTFPIYWHEGKSRRLSEIVAPFARSEA